MSMNAPMKARDIMHAEAECIPADETLDRAAQMMRNMDVGALPICENDRLVGMVTDRDIVVRCIAEGHDPSRVRAGDLAKGTPRWVDADAELQQVLDIMEQNQIKRLPVMENKRLIGMISEADLAKNISDSKLAEFISAVYVPH
ncbi:CBS domain-containing protein [Nocardia amikacinitolerans]|uniref:CBS domain-containing protein n=2 Tax=Nocardia amikacinitolerans TaxID=756689 RepID=A0A285LBE9_9NOCA|nr:CBS domain-containing protein [Nocardia amikacinitolerans]MCP2296333.1 CBS domain-containing protein [Nocardia amikacinitolerans]MCP2316229.1 CBS domain-containing protein [Nocardia amikacinitolerans]SNY80711.1 CBS domain-containing protein [Nocardia amikacinitolerans]